MRTQGREKERTRRNLQRTRKEDRRRTKAKKKEKHYSDRHERGFGVVERRDMRKTLNRFYKHGSEGGNNEQ